MVCCQPAPPPTPPTVLPLPLCPTITVSGLKNWMMWIDLGSYERTPRIASSAVSVSGAHCATYCRAPPWRTRAADAVGPSDRRATRVA